MKNLNLSKSKRFFKKKSPQKLFKLKQINVCEIFHGNSIKNFLNFTKKNKFYLN